MSGKSTMLRTVGFNLVLAYSGSPVCAQSMSCSVMDICSSMRIADNLEEKVSTFYAELIRIKMIIEAARTNKPVIVLLDEILRGTNTRDRRIGVEAVLKNLSSCNLLGIISTHDLEIADLAGDEQFKITNFHFKEDYIDSRIFFDYNIHNGSYNGSDAIYLMRMIGIEL
jgi:DNA mismatch repair ATPase MutS